MSKWQRHYEFFVDDGYSMMPDDDVLSEVRSFFTAFPNIEDKFVDWAATRYANKKSDEFDEYQLTKNNY